LHPPDSWLRYRGVSHFYDAHQHFHFDQLTPYRGTIDADLHRNGVRRVVVNATNEEEWPVVAALADDYDWVLPSHGVHPWDSGNRSATWLSGLRARLETDPRAAVGEIGLDRWIIDGIKPDDPRIAGLRVAPLDEQAEVFGAQLALAAELNRAASIHCVQAWGALLDVLQKTARPARGFLLHGYPGPAEMISAFTRLGAFYSFNIELTHPRHEGRLENFRAIPADRLLVETDAPYLTPVPHRGTPNRPALVPLVGHAISGLKSEPVDNIATVTWANAATVFGL
jgi:TatD DNase family protein